eukprot:3440922-Rhodomonas_salina.5
MCSDSQGRLVVEQGARAGTSGGGREERGEAAVRLRYRGAYHTGTSPRARTGCAVRGTEVGDHDGGTAGGAERDRGGESQ